MTNQLTLSRFFPCLRWARNGVAQWQRYDCCQGGHQRARSGRAPAIPLNTGRGLEGEPVLCRLHKDRSHTAQHPQHTAATPALSKKPQLSSHTTDIQESQGIAPASSKEPVDRCLEVISSCQSEIRQEVVITTKDSIWWKQIFD